MITLPLATQTAVNGAVSFYFAEPHTFSDDERSLLRLISEQLAATTTRARVLDDLRIENERLRLDAEHLAAAIREAEIDANRHDRLMAGVINELTVALDTGGNGTRAGGADNHHLARLVDDLTELLDLRLGRVTLDASPGDALRLARHAAGLAGTPQPGAEFSINAGDAIIAVTTDGPRVTRTLSAMLREAFRRTARGSILLSVRAVREESGQWVEWAVSTRGIGLDAGGTSAQSDGRSGAERLAAALAFTTAEALGGSLLENAEPVNGWSQRLRLPLRAGRPRA
jgi:hypothetical protein